MEARPTRMKHSEPDDGIRELARTDLPALRTTMRKLGVIVAEVDCDLRYVWIDNPHPDFDPAAVIGKRDDELIPPAEAVEIMGVKRAVLQQRKTFSRVLAFNRSDGWRHYSFRAFPVRNARGRIDGIFTIGFETQEAKPKPVRRD